MSSQRLLNKVAIVTGASQGIGREISNQFFLEGALLVCADLSPQSAANPALIATHEWISQRGGRAIHVTADVGSAEQMEKLVAAAVAEFGHVDIFVNNAGIFPETHAAIVPFNMADQQLFDKTLRLNVSGAFFGAKYAVAQMKKQERHGNDTRGWVVNIASISGMIGLAGIPGYTASKGAIIAMTRAVAMDAAKDGIVCNCIAPGFTETPGMDLAYDGFLGGARPSDVASSIPLQRLGKPLDIARAAVFLASGDASWVTGITLAVDGGSTSQ
ncbi:NAD(P)-binding protein [Polyplosphaeria fusca]|uniref:NAD(P)-binding protein n=1 Tax=Polyplosphaeria fusca TaxID=682080 RepID=A0A9P4UVN4_9PLEO|nr:NAD(P)-binding protein [Polyplosphaeria fusca]